MFSRLARLAFVGLGILRSLRDSGTISGEFYESFLASPRTIADEVRAACHRVATKRLSAPDFFRDFGFLRTDVLQPAFLALRSDAGRLVARDLGYACAPNTTRRVCRTPGVGPHRPKR